MQLRLRVHMPYEQNIAELQEKKCEVVQKKMSSSGLLHLLGQNAYRGPGTTGTDKITTHAYGPLYEKLFTPLRDSAKRVLEIGVHTGASVLAFAEFFVNAEVDGIDINMRDLRFGTVHPRIRYHIVDGTRPEAAQRVRKSSADLFDVIVEDASHLPEHQVASLDVFGPLLAPGGVYVIEDIGDVTVRPRLEAVAARHGLVGPEWHDLRAVSGQFDDVVAVFRRETQ